MINNEDKNNEYKNDESKNIEKSIFIPKKVQFENSNYFHQESIETINNNFALKTNEKISEQLVSSNYFKNILNKILNWFCL